MPRIFLPLDKIEKCHVCGSVGHLRLCSQCAECAYCSVECQKRDWRVHKSTCKTDRIDLTSYYPVLACIAEIARIRVEDIHPALKYQVTNSPTPDSRAYTLPDKSSARIVKLGRLVPESEWKHDMSHWWPSGPTPAVRSKLMRRIAREGRVLPIVASTCLALMLAMYSTTTTTTTTTKGAEEPHRIRLRYRSSPISDFGIVAGSARVTPEDQLAYIMPDGSIMKGQDPKDHYWIYFRTQKGEEVLLDCSMFTFNMCLVAHTDAYFNDTLAYGPGFPQLVPAWFKDRTMSRELANTHPLLMERRRFSALRDEGILKALNDVEHKSNGDLGMADESLKTFTTFMSRAAGRTITDLEKQCFMKSFMTGTNIISDTLRTSSWKGFPAQPKMGIETDPGEVVD